MEQCVQFSVGDLWAKAADLQRVQRLAGLRGAWESQQLGPHAKQFSLVAEVCEPRGMVLR